MYKNNTNTNIVLCVLNQNFKGFYYFVHHYLSVTNCNQHIYIVYHLEEPLQTSLWFRTATSV